MLRDFELLMRIGLHALVQSVAQVLQYRGSRARCDVRERPSCRSEPIQLNRICPSLQVLHVARVVGDRAIQVLNRVGAPERAVECALEAVTVRISIGHAWI